MQQERGVQETSRLAAAGFAAAFFVVTSLTIFWTRFNGGLALIWPGTAILAALLVTLPRRRWPGALALFAGLSTLATSLFGLGPRPAFALALVNVFEGWVIAALLLALRPQRDWIERVSGLAVLIAVAGVIGPALAAVPGSAIVADSVGGGWREHVLDWIPGHGLGTLLAFPLASMAASGTLGGVLGRRHPAEILTHTVAVAGISTLAFFEAIYPLLFLPVVPLLLASLRLGRLGASLGLMFIAGAAAVSIRAETGFFHALDLPFGSLALYVQFYLATLLILALPVSVALRQHKELVAELEDRKALKSLIAENSDDALLNLDEDGRIRYASPAGARLSGVDELEGEPLGIFFDPLDDVLVRAALAEAAARPGETLLLERAVLRGEEQIWLEAKLRAVAPVGRTSALQGFAVTIRDITRRKHAELDAIQAAETDPLTGLPNRRGLLRLLERSLAHAEHRPFALAILDLDHFKRVNDTHGHITGDIVLREVAGVMRRMSSPTCFFARLGGEEFAVVSREASFDASEQLCVKLSARIRRLDFIGADGAPFHVTASIGLARIDHRVAAAQALQSADALLYQAKANGRDRVEAAPRHPAPRLHRRAA